MGQFSKKWEDLEFSDNYIFCKAMRNKNLCRKMIEILLGIKADGITYIDTEHIVDEFYGSRGIRMDVFAEDSSRVYDIEMQTGNYDDLLLRARYYQSASDVSTTPRRTKYRELKETYIIFICLDDPFGEGLPLYTERKSFIETDRIRYDDKTRKLFYNASAFEKAESKDVRDVLEFIYTMRAGSSFTRELEDFVNGAKAEPVFKDEYMYFADILEDEKEEARMTGHEEGFAQGLKDGISQGIQQGIQKGIQEGISQGIAEGAAQQKAEDDKLLAQKDAEVARQAERIRQLEAALAEKQK